MRLKRLISAFIACAMLVTFMPMQAFAIDDLEKNLEPNPVTSDDGLVTVRKTAARVDGQEYTYDITLSVTTKDEVVQSQEPTHAVLVIDGSGSMKGERLAQMKEAAKSFVQVMLGEGTAEDNQVAIVSYSDDGQTLQGFTRNQSDLEQAIDGVKANGGTNIQAGLYQAEQLIDEDTSEADKVIVLFSDGYPTYCYELIGTASGNCNGSGLGGPATEVYGDSIQITDRNTDKRIGAGNDDAVTGPWWDILDLFASNVHLTVTCTADYWGHDFIWGENHTFPEDVEYDYATKSLVEKVDTSSATLWEGDQAKQMADVYTVLLNPKDSTEATKAQELMEELASGNKYYNAEDAEELAGLFKGIADEVAKPTKAGIVTDPMGEFVELDASSVADKPGVTVKDNILTWDVSQAEPVENDDGSKRYTLTYHVTVDTDNAKFETGVHALNGETTFKYTTDGTEETVTFNVPTTYETAVRYQVTYNWGEKPASVFDEDGQEVTLEIPSDLNNYADEATYTVDDTYSEGYTVYTHDQNGNVNGKYIFSGWKLGDEVVTGQQKIAAENVELQGSWTFTDMSDPAIAYDYIRIYMDDATEADFDALEGNEIAKQVRIYSDKYQLEYRPTAPMGDYWWTENSQNVTENDISKVVLAKDKWIGASAKIEIPIQGNAIYNVAISEGEDTFLGTPYNYLKIDITKKVYIIHVNFQNEAGTLYYSDACTSTDLSKVITPPTIEVPDEKELIGWKMIGTSDEDVYNGTFNFSELSELVKDNWTDEGENWLTFVPVLKDKDDSDAGKTLKIHWAIDNPDAASWKNGEASAYTQTVEWEQRGDTFEMPGLEIEEGYHLAGWSVSGAEANYWDSETYEFGLTGLIAEDTEGGHVSITANIVSDEPEVKKTLKIHWAIDNPDAASWKNGEASAYTQTVEWEQRGDTFEMPELEIEEGYHLAGWSVSGNEANYWDPETYEFGLTGLIAEDTEGGHVSITANIVSDEPEAEKTLKIHWAIDNPDAASWKGGEASAYTQTVEWEQREDTFAMPELEIEEGYHLAGWSVSGETGEYWGADEETFKLDGLIVENEQGGDVSITANIVSDEPVSYAAEVTFRVRNGSWNDGTATDIIKNFELHSEDDTYTLTENDIPSVGNEPDRGYERGEWRTDPEGVEVGIDGATFIYIYDEEGTSGGGGGAQHPDAGDDDDDDNDRDDDTEEIIDEEVPLAETPWLNTEDHYAYVVGYSEDGTVRPNANITRAEVATIFFRLLTDNARDQFWMTSNNFSDVLPNDWYNTAVSTMVNMGIIQGYEDGTFRPNANITRAEFATIAARFLASGYEVEDDLFGDIAAHWARESINDAAMAGWINGYEDGTFRPDAAITRAEAVTMVNNVLGRKPDADHMLDSMIKWTDNMDTSAWYYEAIQEATNSHDYDLFEGAEYETWTALQENRDWAALEKDWANAHVS